jgi:hypothetical protein
MTTRPNVCARYPTGGMVVPHAFRATMGLMLALLFVGAVASAVASDSAADTASALTKEDVCRLVVLAARKELVVPEGRTNLLAQSVTSKLAGEHGRIWMDVWVSEHGRSRSPLARGDSCGDHELVELCDWERLGNRCSRARKDRERWRVVVVLSLVDDDHVDSSAALAKPPRVHRYTTSATMSPVPAFRGHFERADGGWREGTDAMTERRGRNRAPDSQGLPSP